MVHGFDAQFFMVKTPLAFYQLHPEIIRCG